ncbi:MAG TPA: hypothetical protein VIJ68_03985 [Candidatus Saccharimonadales bacterium]
MASQLQDPNVQNPEDADDYDQETGLGAGQARAAGNASGPHRDTTAAGNPSDPRSQAPGASPKSNSVYDPDSEKPNLGRKAPVPPSDEGLRHMTGINPDEEAAMDRGALQNAEEGGLYRPGEPGSDTGSLKDSEEDGDEQFGRGFDSQKPEKNRKKFLARNKRKFIIGGGLAGGITGGGALLLLLLIPLKIENIVQNLESRFFSSPQAAVSSMTQHLLKDYFVQWVIPDYKKCGTTVDKSCKVSITSTDHGPVTNLFRAWSSEKLENRLATTYGIEFKFDTASHVWRVKAPGTSSAGDSIGSNGQSLGDEFTRPDRKGFQAASDLAVGDATGFKKIFLRLQLNAFGSLKFGNKHYVFFNGTRTLIDNKITDLKQSAKIAITQRVITPYNQSLGIALQCLLTDCDPTSSQPTDPNAAPDENGFPENSATDTAIRQNLADLVSKIPGANLEDVLATYKEISTKGFQNYVVKKALTPIIGEANAQSAADKIPIIGWLNLAAQLINGANDIGPKAKKLDYVLGIGAAVNMFVLYQTYADEIHTGHANATQVGSMVGSLNGGNNGDSNDPEMGGTASAEEAPVYNSLINKNTAPSITGSLLGSILPAKASAATVGSKNSAFGPYLCNNNKPVPSGQLVCPEEVFGGGNAVANSVTDFLTNTPVVGAITTMAQAWRSTFGAISQFAGGILGDAMNLASKPANAACDASNATGIPLPSQFERYCKARDLIKKASPDIIRGVATALLPDPFGTNMSGGRKVDMMAAGADGEGNTYAQVGLGAKKVTPAVSGAIYQQQQDEAKRQFDQQPLFARMFDTNSQFSLVSSLAMAVPLNLGSSLASGFASLLSNPFGALGNGFASIFSGKTSAAVTASDPFGIPQYAYPSGSIPNDPVKYWGQHCSDNPAQAYQSDADYAAHSWNQANSSTIDPDNGMPESDATNPCLLIKASVGAAGGLFDSTLLTKEDLGQVNASGPASAIATASGNAQQLAQQILSSSNVDTSYSSSVKADLQDAAAGKVGTAGAMTSAALLQLIVTLAQNHKLAITAIQSNGQGHCNNTPKSGCPDDPHYTGDAVDFGSLDGVTITGRNDPAITIMKQAFSTLPGGSGFGQDACGGPGAQYTTNSSLPKGDITFDDTCNHLHVQVPKGTP